MVITATELKNNLGKYLELAGSEDVFITKNGSQIAKLTNTKADRKQEMRGLFAAFDSLERGDMPTLDETRSERLGVS